MAYTIENGMWRSVFAVPSDIVDIHLKLFGEVHLKVLLALLRYNGGLDIQALCEVAGKPEHLVREALEYLIEEGVVADGAAQRRPRLEYTRVEEPEKEDVSSARRVTTVSSGRRRFERGEIAELAKDDENVAWLLQESQSVLGKTLSAVATDTVVALYSYYGMKPDVIMMVLQYCVGIDKANMRYIEKVAASWIENGIETHEQAEREIQRRTQRKAAESRIKSIFGISDRALGQSEKKYISAWLSDYGFDIPMISLAFERTIETKAKLSFAYINGILSNWHKKGIKTPADAIRDMKEASPQKQSAQPVQAKPSSYDLNELETLLNQGEL